MDNAPAPCRHRGPSPFQRGCPKGGGLRSRDLLYLWEPPQQRQGNGPEDRPQRHEDHETAVLGLVPEEHHAQPAAQSPAQARHPQQHPLRDAAASLVLRLRLVHAVEDEAQEVDEEEV